MVKYTEIQKSNSSISSLPPGLVAVFAGATSGVGLATLKALATHANGPRAYIIGRSVKKANHVINKMKMINPMGTFMFIKGELSLLKDVDRMCEEIKKFETHVDVLCMSTGYGGSGGGHDTSEGIPTSIALQFYSRARLLLNLIPLLEASTSPRVISLLAPGSEAPLNTSDLLCRNTKNATPAASTLTTLLFERLSSSHPTIPYIHSYPGALPSHLLSSTLASTPGLLWYPAQIPRWTILPLYEHLMCISEDEAGERTLFLATSTRYPAAVDHGKTGKIDGFVERSGGVGVARSTIMEEGRGNGVFRVNWDGEVFGESKVLEGCRGREEGKVVLEGTRALFEKVVNGTGEGLSSPPRVDSKALDFEVDETQIK